MAPFGIPSTGFCMVFLKHATLAFSTLGTNFDPGDPNLGPGAHIWAWSPNLGSKLGPGPLGPRAPLGPRGPIWQPYGNHLGPMWALSGPLFIHSFNQDSLSVGPLVNSVGSLLDWSPTRTIATTRAQKLASEKTRV